MKKGLIAALTVASLTCVGSSFAIAPTILSLPNITIGDAEDQIGTDNNFFVISNAFTFADKAVDTDTPKSQLKWSFDEHDAFDGTETNKAWFQINGKSAIHANDQAMVDEGAAATDHLNPGANELSAAGTGATIRDIILSPADKTAPFAEPSAADKARHANGKFVAFFVSDGYNVASKEVFVNTVDDAFDSASGDTSYVEKIRNPFDTNPDTPAGSIDGWSSMAQNTSGKGVPSYNTTAKALQAQIWADPTGTTFRAAGYTANSTDWLKYSEIGSDKYVRAKFYVYAYGHTVGTGDTAANVIPNIRVRAANRYAVNSMLEILHHDNADPGAKQYSGEFKPSTDPAKPSLYRVDYDPVDVPYLVSNATAEGVSRAFEAYTVNPQDNGYIVVTESVIGTYSASELDNSLALAGGTKIYKTSTSDAGDLKVFNSLTDISIKNLNLNANTAVGGFAGDDTSAKGTYTESANGVTMDTTNVAVWPVCGLITREFDPDGGTGNFASRVRIEANRQYKIRWHITSTVQSNVNAQIRLRARAVKFQWTQKYEIGGAWATTSVANATIAAQALPGVNCKNPDKNGTENGGWYTMLMLSPLNPDIRADVDGDMAAKMPKLMGQPGTGVNQASSYRDLRLGCDVCDTLSVSANNILEKGNFTIDQIEVRSFNLVDDGGY